MRYVNLDKARYPDQKAVMEQILVDGVCPFCRENLTRYHTEPILWEGDFWLMTTTQWPKENTSRHLLIIYKKHAQSLKDLDPASGTELITLLQLLEESYQVSGGAFFMRFGDPVYSSASVNHLHIQFIVPDIDAPDYLPVRVRIG